MWADHAILAPRLSCWNCLVCDCPSCPVVGSRSAVFILTLLWGRRCEAGWHSGPFPWLPVTPSRLASPKAVWTQIKNWLPDPPEFGEHEVGVPGILGYPTDWRYV